MFRMLCCTLIIIQMSVIALSNGIDKISNNVRLMETPSRQSSSILIGQRRNSFASEAFHRFQIQQGQVFSPKRDVNQVAAIAAIGYFALKIAKIAIRSAVLMIQTADPMLPVFVSDLLLM